jgi:hypothetical protein
MALVLIQTQQQQIIVITILISSNQNYELEVTQGSTTLVKKFTRYCKTLVQQSGTMLSVYKTESITHYRCYQSYFGTGCAVKGFYMLREVLITGNLPMLIR